MILEIGSDQRTMRETARDAERNDTLSRSSVKGIRWAGRIGLVLESPELAGELTRVLEAGETDVAFRMAPGAAALEIASTAERERADLMFVELARVQGQAGVWIDAVRAGLDTPLIVAVDSKPDPAVMIEAVRAGANEYLSLSDEPGQTEAVLHEVLERLTTIIEARRATAKTRGRMAGILSAKGGCGATTVACHLAAALGISGDRVLVADLDAQCAGTHHTFRVATGLRAGDAFRNVRRLNAASWPGFVTPAAAGVELLAGYETGSEDGPPLNEPWRVEGTFRFVARNYGWVLTDLGRNLNPATWTFLQHLDELFVVTAPDVLALYQTRSILQTLAGRGFDKGRLNLILNRNRKGPRDFWIESIKKMFEMDVIAVIPEDGATLEKLPRERFEFPAASPFGRAVSKLAGSLAKREGAAGRGKEEAGRKA